MIRERAGGGGAPEQRRGPSGAGGKLLRWAGRRGRSLESAGLAGLRSRPGNACSQRAPLPLGLLGGFRAVAGQSRDKQVGLWVFPLLQLGDQPEEHYFDLLRILDFCFIFFYTFLLNT